MKNSPTMQMTLKLSFPYKEVIKILLLLLIGGYFVYALHGTIYNFIYFTFIFVLYNRSKKDVFWIAFFWILISYPWGLFYHRYNAYYIQITSKVGIEFSSIIPLVIYLKYLRQKHNYQSLSVDLFRRYYKILAFMLIFLFFWGTLWGFSMRQIAWLIDYLPSVLLFLVIPRLFNYKKLIHFNNIVFLFTIFYVLTTIIDTVSNGVVQKFMSFGSTDLAATAMTKIGSKELVRQMGGIFISLYSMILSLYYIINNKKEFSGLYLWLTCLLSILFIVNSATRGWMIAAFFLLFMFLISFGIKSQFAPKLAIVIFIGASLITLLSTGYINNLLLSLERFRTVEAIAQGDMTAGGTAHRWDLRGPAVLTRFKESPIFGFGLSATSINYFDKHVGNHVILLISGVFGFALFYILIFVMIFHIYKLSRKIDSGFYILALAIVCVLIIHATSRLMVGYLMPVDTAFFLAIIFNHINSSLENFKGKQNYGQES